MSDTDVVYACGTISQRECCAKSGPDIANAGGDGRYQHASCGRAAGQVDSRGKVSSYVMSGTDIRSIDLCARYAMSSTGP
eukprot:2469211-Rhodomonas_salina.1